MLEDLDNALPPVHQVAVRASVTGRCQDGTAVAETSEQLEATLPIGRVLSTVARADEHRAEAVPGPGRRGWRPRWPRSTPTSTSLVHPSSRRRSPISRVARRTPPPAARCLPGRASATGDQGPYPRTSLTRGAHGSLTGAGGSTKGGTALAERCGLSGRCRTD